MRLLPYLISASAVALCAFFADFAAAAEPETINIGSQRELFIDGYLVDSLDSAEILMHRPERKNVVVTFDKPWEKDGEGYATLLKIDSKYLMFYRAWGVAPGTPMYFAVLESENGVDWTRPELGIREYGGDKRNNIILDEVVPGSKLGTHDFTPFLDLKPGVPADEKYKAIGFGWYHDGGKGEHGLYAWKSPDAIHWTLIQNDPVYTDGKFDTQNIAFWSAKEQKYVLYYREFVNDVRVVMRAVSDDFVHWTNEGQIQFPPGQGPSLREQFYTNQIQPYYRAPHIYVGLPTRYVDNGMTASTPLLPDWDLRQERMKLFKGGERLGTATTDVLFISSRDGVHFTRSDEPFITPGLHTSKNWFYGDNYLAWNIIETLSPEDDSPNELSFYNIEAADGNGGTRIRRYALRIDGFASIHAKANQGYMTTKPLTFEGKELSINFATSSNGLIFVEVLDENGYVVPGFSKLECDPIYGDSLDRRVTWKGSADMSKLQGKPIRLRFSLVEADLYSIKWE